MLTDYFDERGIEDIFDYIPPQKTNRIFTPKDVVKCLYQSEEMKRQFPDNAERLRHIFEKQVYGLAPTEIIYKIDTSFILGFDEGVQITKHNFRQVDALPYAKEGTLQEKLDELFD